MASNFTNDQSTYFEDYIDNGLQNESGSLQLSIPNSELDFPTPPMPFRNLDNKLDTKTMNQRKYVNSRSSSCQLTNFNVSEKDPQYISSEISPIKKTFVDLNNSCNTRSRLKHKFFKNKNSYDILPVFQSSPGILSPNNSINSPQISKSKKSSKSSLSQYSGSLSNLSSSNEKSSFPREIPKAASIKSINTDDTDKWSVISSINSETSQALIYILMKKLLKRKERKAIQEAINKYIISFDYKVEKLALMAVHILNHPDNVIIVKELRNIIRDNDKYMFDRIVSPSEQAAQNLLTDKQRKKVSRDKFRRLSLTLSNPHDEKPFKEKRSSDGRKVSKFFSKNTMENKEKKSFEMINKYRSLDALDKINERKTFNDDFDRDSGSINDNTKSVRILDQQNLERKTLRFFNSFRSGNP